jgi:hypothetical protein
LYADCLYVGVQDDLVGGEDLQLHCLSHVV